MTYKTLLVAVENGTEADARVSLARDLAAAMDARLIGACAVSLSIPPMDDPYTGGAMVGEALTLFRDLAEADLRAALTRFHTSVGGRPNQTEWRGRLGLPADLIVHEARAADLVILGRRPAKAVAGSVDPADVLMAAGRPVLVVPPQPERDPTGWPAVLAWKDSREAQRAAAAALPLLRHASMVHVVEIHDGDAEAPAARTADVAAWLGRHGIAAEAHTRVTGTGGVARNIQDFAADRGAGLIVAGGYGHARLREWALGGVTHELLASSSVCVLLSH